MSCPRCDKPQIEMTDEVAKATYDKLGPFLELIPSWGCLVARLPNGQVTSIKGVHYELDERGEGILVLETGKQRKD